MDHTIYNPLTMRYANTAYFYDLPKCNRYMSRIFHKFILIKFVVQKVFRMLLIVSVLYKLKYLCNFIKLCLNYKNRF